MKYLLLLLLSLSLTNIKADPIQLTPEQANFVAMKVWQNEGAGLDKYLVHWNDGEDFASVGIGHFIWFPKGHTEKFREVFPMVVAFMESKKVAMPHWLNSSTPLLWNSKSEFYAAKNSNSKKYKELFEFLKTTQAHQAEFLAQRLNKALPQILASIEDPEKKKVIEYRFNNILNNKDGSVNERGIYVLLDYINFKGEGTLLSERYNGQGWGLLQVLENLNPDEENRFKAFAKSAEAMLSRRIKNSPPERGEERWRKNWTNRVNGYWK